MYDFDTPAPRAGTGALKWDLRGPAFQNPEALPFWVADSDYNSPPELVDTLRDAAARCIFGYTTPTGSYLDAVSLWFKTRHGWEVPHDWILPSTGVVSELANLIRCFTAPGDRIILQPPVYDPFAGCVKSAGRTVVENRLAGDAATGYTMDLEDLERDLKGGASMMILCSPHNPVGRVWTPGEVRQVAALCADHGCLLVSDEIHWDILAPGQTHFTAGLAGTPDNLVVLTAPSKTFNTAGLKCSNTVIPSDRLRRKYTAWRESRHIETTNNFGLIACEAVYRHGGAWCDEQNAYLAQNAALVRRVLGERLPEVAIADLQGTYLMWLDMTPSGATSKELTHAMAKAGALLNDGARYGAEGYTRLNLACPRSQLEKGLESVIAGYLAAKK